MRTQKTNKLYSPQSVGTGDDFQNEINKQGEVESLQLQKALDQNLDRVVDWLIVLVSEIKPEVSDLLFTGFLGRYISFLPWEGIL